VQNKQPLESIYKLNIGSTSYKAIYFAKPKMRIILNFINAAKIIILFFYNARAFIFIFENKKLKHIILLILMNQQHLYRAQHNNSYIENTLEDDEVLRKT
jgi:hypothetical protein